MKRGRIFGLALLCAALTLCSTQSADAVRRALRLCGEVVVPSLFPFLVLSALTVQTGLAHRLGCLLSPLMVPLFRLSGACACPLVLGLLGGYPIGAACAAELAERGVCEPEEVEHLLGFCNNSGPGFILGAVGAGMLGSFRAGLLLYAIHVAAALLTGCILRFFRKPSRPVPPAAVPLRGIADALPDAVTGAVRSALLICGYVTCFGVLTALLSAAGLSRLPGWLAGAVSGFLELTNGAHLLAALPLRHALPLLAALLGWGGLSVHAQTLSLLRRAGLSPRRHRIGKALHALLSGALALPCARFSDAIPAAAMLPPPVSTPGKAAALFLLWFFFCLLGLGISKNGWKSAKK